MAETIDQLIINSPYKKPSEHWYYERTIQQFVRLEGRRPAGYVVASTGGGFDDPGVFHEIDLANVIRERLEKWQDDGRPGLTGITKRLLEYWTLEDRESKFFFCQLEAIETLIFLIEAPDSYKIGIEIPSDGGAFQRLCSKMATGTGKTVVMSIIIAWNILNKVTYPRDTRFSKNILVVAPGLTVKSRLSVLQPSDPSNYYTKFDIVPSDLKQKLYEGKVKVINWHMLAPLKEVQRSVVKIGLESNEAYVRRVLEDMSGASNILVINDEAHHAWRLREWETEVDYGKHKLEARDATVWVKGLDRIHKTRHILRCFDMSATPFRPMGDKSEKELLFGWIVSDFGLNDAIESGLVKTPRIVVRSDSMQLDAQTMKPRLYHIYNDDEVKHSLGNELPTEPLPDLVRNAYYLLAQDWQRTRDIWLQQGHPVPPVMISVANRTETAARIEHSFRAKQLEVGDLNDWDKMLRIDSKVLTSAEQKNAEDTEKYTGKTKNEYREHLEAIVHSNTSLSDDERDRLLDLKDEELLREMVDSVGVFKQAGEQIQHVIAVAMLSEGWDTKNVTHIMGLRAFSSQLLCEQVVGRGLRRVNYEINPETGLLDPEYVNIFGVPFSFIPSEGGDDNPRPPSPQTRIEVNPDHEQFEIRWPNIKRIEYNHNYKLNLDVSQIPVLEIDSHSIDTVAELQGAISGRGIGELSTIDLQELANKYRLQHLVFRVSGEIVDKLAGASNGKINKYILLPKVIRVTEDFIRANKISFSSIFDNDPLRQNVLMLLNVNKIVQHITDSIHFGETVESTTLVFDKEQIFGSTANMPVWYTKRPTETISKSQISHIVGDSEWEMSVGLALDRNDGIGQYVQAWVKNDQHIGFSIPYLWGGVFRTYIPDFMIRLTNGKMLLLEVKGVDDERNRRKRVYMNEWVKAVNNDGRFGEWLFETMFDPSELDNLIMKHIN